MFERVKAKPKSSTPVSVPALSRPTRPWPVVQAKLEVGQPDDEYEREADRVAEQVVRMPEPCCSGNSNDYDELRLKPIGDSITPLRRIPIEGAYPEASAPTSVAPLVSTDVMQAIIEVLKVDERFMAVMGGLPGWWGNIGPFIRLNTGGDYYENAARICYGVAERAHAALCANIPVGVRAVGTITREWKISDGSGLGHHEANLVVLDDGTELVFDWWATKQVDNPKVSTIDVWLEGCDLMGRHLYCDVSTESAESEPPGEILSPKRDGPGVPVVTPELEQQIQSMRGGGHPLSGSERSFFEPRFGFDFSKVRIHSGPQAAEATRSVNAKAFTVGQDVVLGAGQYVPSTESGGRLLGHELTHVAQQASGPTPGLQCKLALHRGAGKLYGDLTDKEARKQRTKDATQYLGELSSDFELKESSGKVEAKGTACESPTRTTDRCLCEMVASPRQWWIRISDYEWPHTAPSEQYVLVHSTLSPMAMGAWAGGAQAGNRMEQSRARVLGHELCGHAWLFEREMAKNYGRSWPSKKWQHVHPTGDPVELGDKRMSRPSHDPTVQIENIVADEMAGGTGTATPRGLFTDPHSGESFGAVRISGFKRHWLGMPTGILEKLELIAGFIKRTEKSNEEYKVKDPTVGVDILGYSDQGENDAAGTGVSEQRAKLARGLLTVACGVDPSRFYKVEGRGHSAPECCSGPKDNPDCRRVDVYAFGHKAASEEYPASGVATADVADEMRINKDRVEKEMGLTLP